MGPEIYRTFIDAAGGPEALIVIVPNAGGADAYPQDGPGTRGWKAAGATNLHTYFTKDRAVADADTFVAVLKRAGGIWFEGGRQFRLVDAYAGTKTEAAFRDVLARGGVVGGSSAGASILGDFLVRGAPSNNNFIMHSPGYEKGFSYLRNTGVDQHVVARDRLADFADSLLPKFPNLLGISEDEGTAWVIRGDTGTIIGKSKGFVYGGKDPNDPDTPLLTLHPGDRYDLGARRVVRRAHEGTALTPDLVRELFRKYEDPVAGGAAVLVAQEGRVLVNRAFGIPAQPKYTPRTTVPAFTLGAIAGIFQAICDQLPEPPARPAAGDTATPAPMTPFQRCVSQRAGPPVGLRKTFATPAGEVRSNVDELYRVSLGLQQNGYARAGSNEPGVPRQPVDGARGWDRDEVDGVVRFRSFATSNGQRSAFVRIPTREITIIVLTNDEGADARGISERLLQAVLAPGR
jgi:cyanophycinase